MLAAALRTRLISEQTDLLETIKDGIRLRIRTLVSEPETAEKADAMSNWKVLLVMVSTKGIIVSRRLESTD
jgi:hypothetical protein